MKKVLLFLSLLLVTSTFMVSCELEFDDPFDESLLLGKWQSGTVYYKYLSDGTGNTWDTSDDVAESETGKFTWTLVQSELTHIHLMALGGSVPKVYTVTELTATTLKYKDDLGKSFSFVKVTE